ncbi:MAG: SDR family NAD(P)-dependent oxidoreductase [Pseudomonadota bacterium]
MTKTILVTGSTDGIGLLTAQLLTERGHEVLLHGRSEDKLATAAERVGGRSKIFAADLSRMAEVEALASAVLAEHEQIDVLINNAGVFHTPQTRTAEGHDVRFVVNTLAAYRLTRLLLPAIPRDGRVINLSSAAQAPVNVEALAGRAPLDDMAAYAQSKLALTIWSREFAKELPDGPAVLAVNPGSLLASKMVKEGFGVAGNDLRIGADILCRAALDDAFASASGKYFDNDSGRFSEPNAAALNPSHSASVVAGIDAALSDLSKA